jgi:hypothetical protein
MKDDEEDNEQDEEESGQSEAVNIPDSTLPSSMPEQWKNLPLQEMVDKGYRPRIRRMRDQEYMSLRKGKNERGLGLYSPEKWDLLMEMFPKLQDDSQDDIAEGLPISQKPNRLIGSGGLLGTKMRRPDSLSGGIGFSLETLKWFEWSKSKGYKGNLSDWVNDIVQDYFTEHGYALAVVWNRDEDGN